MKRAGRTLTRVPPQGIMLCLDCNYPLHGLDTAHCPECGRAFDAADDRTFNPGRPMSRWSRWWLKRTGWWVNLLSLAAAALLIISQTELANRVTFSYGSYTGSNLRLPHRLGIYHEWFELEEFAVWCWVALLLMWTIFAAGRWIVAKGRAQPRWLLIDRPRRRFASSVFLIGLFIAGWQVYSCPHATYFRWWDLAGVTYHRPCRGKAPHSIHIVGEWYLY